MESLKKEKRYTIWELLRRWRMMGFTIIISICSIVFIMMFIIFPELLKSIGVMASFGVVTIVAFIYSIQLLLQYKKVKRIVAHSIILQTKVTNAIAFYTSTIIGGRYWISSTYFDDKTGRQYNFRFTGDVNKPLNKERAFKQGETIYELRTINVCANQENFGDYVVLFEEEWNIQN